MTQRRIYQDIYPYFVTTKTLDNKPIFGDIKLATFLLYVILGSCRLKKYDLIISSILPNHIHFLVQKHNRRPESLCCGEKNVFIYSSQRTFSKVRLLRKHEYIISDLMQSIKGTSSRSLNLGHIWQPRFNYRIIDNQKRLRNTISYIKGNYKKHNLIGKYSLHPYLYINHKKINELLF